MKTALPSMKEKKKEKIICTFWKTNRQTKKTKQTSKQKFKSTHFTY